MHPCRGRRGPSPPASARTILTDCTSVTVPGNYKLGNDITAAGDCFTIEADHVALDFDRRKRPSDGTGGGLADGGTTGRRGIVIIDGTITNFNTGIDRSTAPGDNRPILTIEEMSVLNRTADGSHIPGCCNCYGTERTHSLPTGLRAGSGWAP